MARHGSVLHPQPLHFLWKKVCSGGEKGRKKKGRLDKNSLRMKIWVRR